jgi:hypothetical protein
VTFVSNNRAPEAHRYDWIAHNGFILLLGDELRVDRNKLGWLGRIYGGAKFMTGYSQLANEAAEVEFSLTANRTPDGIAKLTDAKTYAGNRRAIASHHAA